MGNCITTTRHPEPSLPEPLPPGPSGNASGTSVGAGLPSHAPGRSSTSLPAGLEGLPALRSNTSTTQAQADAKSTPAHFDALPRELKIEILQHLDGPTLDSAMSVSRNFKTCTQFARRDQVEELAEQTGRFTQVVLPTRLELVGMGIPRPNIRNILNTLQPTPIGAVIVPGQLTAHMQAHAELQQQVEMGHVVPRVANYITDLGQVNDQGLTHGFGIRTYQNQLRQPGRRYEGAFDNSQPHGLGYEVFGNADRYEGNYDNGRQQGHGTYLFANGARYEGLFENGKPHGQGTFISVDGDCNVGIHENGIRHSQGTSIDADGDRYEGMFENCLQHGQGTLICANGNRYEGMFENGQEHGQGTLIYAGGDRYEGMFENGQEHGQGTFIYATGDRYEGMF